MAIDPPILTWEERAARPPTDQPTLLLLPIGEDAADLVDEFSEHQKLYGVQVVDARDFLPKEPDELVKKMESNNIMVTILHGEKTQDDDDPGLKYNNARLLLDRAANLGRRVIIFLPSAWVDESWPKEETQKKFIESLRIENTISAYYSRIADTRALMCELADRISVDPDASPIDSHTDEYDKILQILGRNPLQLLKDPAAALQLLSDDPIDSDAEDQLGFRTYADALAGLIDNPETTTPLVLAINAPWGAGKSSLGKMLRNRLRDKAAAGGDAPHATCWFNAWMHDDAENLAGALTAVIARNMYYRLPTFRRWFHPLPWSLQAPSERLRKIKHRTALMFSLALVVSIILVVVQNGPKLCNNPWVSNLCAYIEIEAATDLPADEGATDDNIGFSALLVLITAIGVPLLSLLPQLNSAVQAVGSFVGSPGGESGTGSMQQVHRQLADLIQRSTPPGSRFVIFIDDIERCRPPRCVDILEAVNQLLDHRDVVVVVLADMKAVAANVEIKYSGLAEKHDPGPIDLPKTDHPVYGRLYLQKIIQYQFDLPPLEAGKIQDMLSNLSKAEAETHPSESDERRSYQTPPKSGDVQGSSPAPAGLEAGPGRELGLVKWLLHIVWRRDPEIAVTLGVARQRYARVPAFLYFPINLALKPLIRGTRSGYPFSQRGALDAPDVPGFIDSILAVTWLAHVLGSSIGVLGLLGGGIGLVMINFSIEGNADPGGLIVSLIVLPIVWFVWIMILNLPAYALAFTRARFHSWTQERLRGEARKEGRKLPAKSTSPDSQDDRDKKPPKEPPTMDSAAARRYIEEQRRLRLINDSRQLAEALAEVLDALPTLPRNAKRLLNRLRVQLLLTELRGLLGTVKGRIRPPAVGRWVLLQERWPEVANGLRVRPQIFPQLISAAKKQGSPKTQEDAQEEDNPKAKEEAQEKKSAEKTVVPYIATLSMLTSLYHQDASLRNFLAESQALSGGILEQLVLLREPADSKNNNHSK